MERHPRDMLIGVEFTSGRHRFQAKWRRINANCTFRTGKIGRQMLDGFIIDIRENHVPTYLFENYKTIDYLHFILTNICTHLLLKLKYTVHEIWLSSEID